MAQCKKTQGCVLSVDTRVDDCGTCKGTGTADSAEVAAAKVAKGIGPAPCVDCGGSKTSKNPPLTVAHAGPCLLAGDCSCDLGLAWASLSEKGRFCSVHNRRATTDSALRAREATMAADAAVQVAADVAAAEAKIQDAIAAKNWVVVPTDQLPPEAKTPDGSRVPNGMVAADLQLKKV